MEEEKIDVYREYLNSSDIATEMYRFAIVQAAYGGSLPDKMQPCVISDSLRKKLGCERYSDSVKYLLSLFGAGIIGENILSELLLHNDADIISDVIALERRICSDEEKSPNDKLSCERLAEQLLIAANSKRCDEITSIDFDDVNVIISSDHISIDNGFLVCDEDTRSFFRSLNVMRFFSRDENGRLFADENSRIPSDYYALKYVLPVLDRLYGKEFVEYAYEYAIPFDDMFVSEYEKYVDRVKLKFDFIAYPRKRNICGDHINAYDYAVNTVTDNKLISSELDSKSLYSGSVTLDISEEYSDDELYKKAFDKFSRSHQFGKDTVIEISHCGETTLVVSDGSGNYKKINSDDFHRSLFDFNKIWGIIQNCARSGKIQKADNKIYIPAELMQEIEEEQREFAERMIISQYELMNKNRKSNPIISKLNEMRAVAQQKMGERAIKDQKRQNRNPNSSPVANIKNDESEEN